MNQYHQRFYQTLLGALVFAAALPAMAACTKIGSVTHPITGGGLIKQKGPIGEQIARGSKPGVGTNVARCEASQPAVFQAGYYSPPGWVKGSNHLQTNIPGIGVRIIYKGSGDGDPAGRQYPYTLDKTMPSSPTGYVTIQDTGETIVEFFRTAAQTNGGTLDNVDLGAQWTGTVAAYRLVKIQGVAFTLAACSIDAGDSNKTVSLGDHKASDITRNGVTDWRTFTLTSTDCDLSQMSDAQFTFTGNVATDPQLFAVNGGAQGIGIELWTDGDATDKQVVPGVPLVRKALAGGEAYGFRARYRKLAAQSVKAGRATAVVNLNVSFN